MITFWYPCLPSTLILSLNQCLVPFGNLLVLRSSLPSTLILSLNQCLVPFRNLLVLRYSLPSTLILSLNQCLVPFGNLLVLRFLVWKLYELYLFLIHSIYSTVLVSPHLTTFTIWRRFLKNKIDGKNFVTWKPHTVIIWEKFVAEY
jgi:hypothetical protein